ncbi:guanine deaminase [Knoellia sp. CPCC 206453]|uniref:guanine deaminase n=1 Tax=Knoellia pratensis TaxID=3404796 RepID=UPI00361E3EB2
MTIFRGTFFDVPDNPFTGGVLRSEQDGGIRVVDGTITDRGPWTEVRARHSDDEVEDLTGGLVLPGFVDTHVHYPQIRTIGALGMPLLDWLEKSALPEEARLAHTAYAQEIATEFTAGLVRSGTTTALVFGSHFPGAVDALFTEADRVGLRVTSGLVVSDRILREDLHTDPEEAYTAGKALADRWHGTRRNRYAVIPRFSLSCSDELLDSCRALLKDVPEAWFTSHINENLAEITTVKELFNAEDYLQTYAAHGLVGRRSIFAHNVHPTTGELCDLAAADATVAHCPTSNSALGSGLFPLKEHLDHGVRVALGSDVGAGTGFSILKEGLQAYFMQQLLGDRGRRLAAPDLLHLATMAGADALGLADTVGDFSVGKQFDAVWVNPAAGSTMDVALRHAFSPEDALAKAFALGTSPAVTASWVAGQQLQR